MKFHLLIKQTFIDINEPQGEYMKTSLAVRSLLLFVLSIILLFAFTMLESSIGVMPLWVERIVTFLGFVLPAGAGVVLGVMSLARREGRPWLPLVAILLNGLFAVFHLLIVFMAG
jgi:hypothetical protein